jgi:hypothetical protein
MPPSGSTSSESVAGSTEEWLSRTRYQILVEDLIKDREDVVGSALSVEVMLMGTYPQPGAGPELPLPEVNDRRLFFLISYSDQPELELMPPQYGMLGIDGSSVTWPDLGRSPVYLAEGDSPNDFIERVRDIVVAQR